MAKGNKGVFQSLKDIVCFKSNEDLVLIDIQCRIYKAKRVENALLLACEA